MVEHEAPAHDRGDDERAALRRWIRLLARPRLAGTPGARQAAQRIRRELESLGLQVHELPFTFSTWPGRFGVPAAGAVLSGVAVLAGWLLAAGRPGPAIGVLLVVAAALAAAAKRSHRTVLGFPWGRIETANLLARPPEGTPRFLVMAHLDSKSQPLSSAWRATAIACAMLGWVALTTLAVVALLVPDRPMADAGLAAAALTLVGGALLLACVAGNRSPGALDNASGLATLLGVARRSRGRHDVAYLITDGEELGLAGAASSADRLDGIIGAINLDGLDDHGRFYIVERHGWPRRGHAPHLAGAILGSAAELGLDAERRPLPLGLLVDHIPFVEAGVPAVTLMRGSRQSLRVVHRPSDTVERLQGTGVFLGTALVAGALRLLQPPIAEERNGR